MEAFIVVLAVLAQAVKELWGAMIWDVPYVAAAKVTLIFFGVAALALAVLKVAKVTEKPILISTLATALAVGLFLSVWLFNSPEGAAEWGDFVGGFFAVPALIWFIAAVFLQKEELKLQRKELRQQRAESQKIAQEAQSQSKLMSVQAHIAAMEYIEGEISKIRFDLVNEDLELINDRLPLLASMINVDARDFDVLFCAGYLPDTNEFMFGTPDGSGFNISIPEPVMSLLPVIGTSNIEFETPFKPLMVFAKTTGYEEVIVSKISNEVSHRYVHIIEYLFLRP